MKILTLNQLIKNYTRRLYIGCLLAALVFSIVLIVLSIRRDIESTASSLLTYGRANLETVRVELGFKDQFGLKNALEHIENRFGLKYVYRGNDFDFSQCFVHRKFEDGFGRIDICASKLNQYGIIKHFDTFLGGVYVVFLKEVDLKYLRDAAPFIVVLMAFFGFIFLAAYRRFSENILQPIQQIHAHIDDEKISGSLPIKEFNDLVERIDIAKDSVKNKAIANVIGKVIHSVKKPFYMVANSYSVLKQIPAEEREEYLKKTIPQVESRAKTSDKLLSQLLDLSTEIHINTSHLDIKPILLEAANCFEFADDIDFQFNHTSNVPMDESKILEVMINILANIDDIKRSQSEKEIKVWIKTFESNNLISIVIGNSGSHIPKDQIGKVFDSFYTSGKKNGHGIGLAVAKKYVTSHGGTITAYSNQKTVEFRIELPKTSQIAEKI